MKSGNEDYGAGDCTAASTAEWIEDNISVKLEDFTGVTGVTTECDNPQSVSEITELFGASQNKIHQPHVLLSAKMRSPLMNYLIKNIYHK